MWGETFCFFPVSFKKKKKKKKVLVYWDSTASGGNSNDFVLLRNACVLN